MSPPTTTSGTGARQRGSGAREASSGAREASSGARERPSSGPRKRRSDGERSREAILRAAARLATVEGIEGLSLSRLADAVGMSKSGLFAHFGSKEELQLATIAMASSIYEEVVVVPAQAAAPGVGRLLAYSERFLEHVREEVFPGGCFFASAAAELGTRPGRVRDEAMTVVNGWLALLHAEVVAAQGAGEIEPSLDPAQLVFELDAYLFLANTQFVAGGDEVALERAGRAIETRLNAARAA
jgi:AcrR family transcriptional regulator